MAAKPHGRESCPQRSASPTSYRPILEANRCGQLSRGSRRFAALRHRIPPTVLAEEANLKTDLKQLPHRENYIFQANIQAHPPLGATPSVEHRVEVESTTDAAEQSGSLRLDVASCCASSFVVEVTPDWHHIPVDEKWRPIRNTK